MTAINLLLILLLIFIFSYDIDYYVNLIIRKLRERNKPEEPIKESGTKYWIPKDYRPGVIRLTLDGTEVFETVNGKNYKHYTGLAIINKSVIKSPNAHNKKPRKGLGIHSPV